jgi:hypothetical protein
MILATVPDLHASEREIVSRLNHGLSISIVNDSGKFVAGGNDFCVEFTKAIDADPAPIKNVAVEFAQQVGKIQERPFRAQILEGSTGHFCGNFDIGTQYYQPAFYYVFIRYTDTSGTKRRCRLFLTIKHE